MREGVRVSETGYSLKKLERFYRSPRTTAVTSGGESLVAYARWLDTGGSLRYSGRFRTIIATAAFDAPASRLNGQPSTGYRSNASVGPIANEASFRSVRTRADDICRGIATRLRNSLTVKTRGLWMHECAPRAGIAQRHSEERRTVLTAPQCSELAVDQNEIAIRPHCAAK